MNKDMFSPLTAILMLFFIGVLNTAMATSFTLLHTNDIHAHFSSEKDANHSGGLTRLKTVIDKTRSQSSASLLLDAGDWAEGTIFYTEGAGRESLKLMDYMGYDAAVVGNHDWYNGPDLLLKAINEAKPKMHILGQNFIVEDYAQRDFFRKHIHPYAIKTINGIKIAIIGIVNSESFYSEMLAPVGSYDGINTIDETARYLKTQADVVIALAHSNLNDNVQLLKAAPDLDIVIGGHDHAALTEPIKVQRQGNTAGILVEAGAWARYLGRLDLDFEKGVLQIKSYKLIPVNKDVPEDKVIVEKVKNIEKMIELNLGPVFHDEVATCHQTLYRSGQNPPIADLVVDSYRAEMKADLAFQQIHFVYGELHPGSITSADLFNVLAPIYSFTTKKTWTVQIMKMKGEVLNRLIKLIFTWKMLANYGAIGFSGGTIQLTNNAPLDRVPQLFKVGGDNSTVVKSILINGQPIRPNDVYTIATGIGEIQTIKLLNSLANNAFPILEIKDSQIQSWQVLRNYLHKLKIIDSKTFRPGGRIVRE